MDHEGYISDEEVVMRANAAVAIELEKRKALGVPAVIYDRKTKIIYHLNSDGSKTEIGNRIGKGRYSERVSSKA